MQRDDGHADAGDGGKGKPHQCGHEHHAPADHPDHPGQQVVLEVEVEGPGHPDHRELQQDQPDAALEQEAGKARMPPAVEVRAGAGEKDESWSAEVGDPAGEEDARHGAAGRKAGEDPDVVDGHQDHHGATDQIDGRNPGDGSGGS
jgi:hypothetical protein